MTDLGVEYKLGSLTYIAIPSRKVNGSNEPKDAAGNSPAASLGSFEPLKYDNFFNISVLHVSKEYL
jgi:hypothetical protein